MTLDEAIKKEKRYAEIKERQAEEPQRLFVDDDREKAYRAVIAKEATEARQRAEWLEDLKRYQTIKERLKVVYGECDGLLETFIEQAVENAVSIIEKHEGIDIGDPYKSRLLTDEDVDKWEAYRAIGTPEECRAAVEKQTAKKPEAIDYKKYVGFVKNAKFLRGDYWCPNCSHVVRSGAYCDDCGQKLDWSDE